MMWLSGASKQPVNEVLKEIWGVWLENCQLKQYKGPLPVYSEKQKTYGCCTHFSPVAISLIMLWESDNLWLGATQA